MFQHTQGTGMLPGFSVHYEYLGFQTMISEKQEHFNSWVVMCGKADGERVASRGGGTPSSERGACGGARGELFTCCATPISTGEPCPWILAEILVLAGNEIPPPVRIPPTATNC